MLDALPTIVLVHGAFADASGFGGVIERLEADGYPVVAPPNPLRSLAGDAESVRVRVAAIEGPVVLVGHGYGGAVITQASATSEQVIGLVYLAAFGLDIGESCETAQAGHPPSLAAAHLDPTTYDAPGTAGGPDLFVDARWFREVRCADCSEEQARVMAVTQRPLAACAFVEPAAAKGWDITPSWFLIAAEDRSVAPEVQRAMAERMHATTETIGGSHSMCVASPGPVATFVRCAAESFVSRAARS